MTHFISATGRVAAAYAKAVIQNPKDTVYANMERAFKERPDIAIALDHHDDLLAQLIASHKAIDWLMARLISVKTGDEMFMPTKSPIWPTVQKNAEVIKAAGGEL